MKKEIRFAVVGLGHIAQMAVLPAFGHAKGKAKLSALVSGDATKLRKLGRKYKVPKTHLFSYEQFDLCLTSGEIDAVYIALPNSLHAAFAVRALERGVHVLCEKPMALTEEECRTMIAASERSGAKLMIAYRLHFEQSNLKAISFAKEKLGELRFFQSSFSYQLKDKKNIRLREEEGGNPLWDIGIYCISAARYFFRDEPIEVSGMSVRGSDARFRESDEMVSVTLRFPQDRLANFTCSFGAGTSSSYDVVGTKGRLHLEGAYEYAAPRELTLVVDEKKKKFTYKKSDQFAPELVYFADCVRHDRKPEASGYEGWADVRIILAIEDAIRYERVVSLRNTPRALNEKRRPGLGQWIQRPPVRKPETVHVDPPHDD